jgi:pilus assembly protein CpaE
VLARSAQARAKPSEKATIVSFFGTRGGIGTSTIALNVAISLQGNGHDVILAELNPGQGTIAYELNIPNPVGLTTLLTRSIKDIHLRSVESEIVSHKSGIRLLLASSNPKEVDLDQAVPQIEAVVNNLSSMCTTLVIDLGNHFRPYVRPVLKLCNRIILIVEPVFPSNIVGQEVLESLESDGINRRKIGLALVNRVRTSLQIPWRQVESDLGVELAGIVSPAPEQAHQASQGGTPLLISAPDSLVSDQIRKLAENVAVHIRTNTP